MAKEMQTSLFHLLTRDEGKVQIDLRVGGLAELQVKNFKGIRELSTKFDPITLLVGANNSGKSTLLQAIGLFYYCIEKCGIPDPTGKVILKKQVMPFSSFDLIPAHDIKELVTNGITPSDRKRGIYMWGKLYSGQQFDFTIYSAYSTLMVILLGESAPKKMSKKEFEFASRQPLYVPGFSGVVAKEFLSTNQRVEELLGSGHHNEVLRNLILRLGTDDRIDSLSRILRDEFSVRFEGVQGDPNAMKFLRAAYRDDALRIPLDIISAGSGFLQVLQIITHGLQSPSPILLLDEPDAHMHMQLQEHFINLLRKFAGDHKMQIIMASHSETFSRTMDLSEIRLIDRKTNRSDSFSEPITMRADLNSHGVWPDEPELAEALRIKRVLLCESSPDAELLSSFAMNHIPDWSTVEKQYQVITTEGANDNTVARMQAVVGILNTLLRGNVCVAYLRDRDLMCDERKENAEQQSKAEGLNLVITQRRNRESYLVEPKIIESAILSQRDKVPAEWSSNGVISKLVKGWCLEYCYEELDELPGKVREYNQQWLRNQFTEETAGRGARARLDAFIQKDWYGQINSQEIPWKLMDGRGALKFVRRKLQEKSIMLPDAVLVNHLGAAAIPDDFDRLIEIIKAWK
ncbi:MAG: AAA family ATPase [Dehalococcoidia bacterium]|nr:AAA family ATPase [Dehalococcoidia bacterium]